jgi:hypothetical protein
MLGERQIPWVSQSAWIKSLMATFVRPWQGRGENMGGLFGSRLNNEDEVLGWNRAQQAAFLIYGWQQLRSAIRQTNAAWAKQLRAQEKQQSELLDASDDAAFYGPYSLIVTDQGVRGYLHILNDLCFVKAPNLDLRSWRIDRSAAASDTTAVTNAIKSLSKHTLANFLKLAAEGLATFDWRTSATPKITAEERSRKLVFRGSSGYKELRAQLIRHLKGRDDAAGEAAKRLA